MHTLISQCARREGCVSVCQLYERDAAANYSRENEYSFNGTINLIHNEY